MGEQTREVADLRSKLDTAREGLKYVLDHHMGHECLCGAARATAEASLRLTDPAITGEPQGEPLAQGITPKWQRDAFAGKRV